MCGIVGFLSRARCSDEAGARHTVEAMAKAIAHRGPDDQGLWVDSASHVALGHRRLSIVDLSPGGHQPMRAADDGMVIVFNGEIYNYRELRAELESAGCRFRSSSDTEVLLEAMNRWGVVEACRRAHGMFAFAAWERGRRTLWLGRDRLGKKPLYLYADPSGGLAFASELKAFWQLPGFSPSLDRSAVAEFFRHSYVGDQHSIFSGVGKVMPGTVVEASLDCAPRTHTYWSLADVVENQTAQRILDPVEAEDRLLALLKDATCRRMVADVPLGAFLSGGIDSGLVVSLMQEASTSRIRTFSIGFREAAYDEAPVAKSVAAHLGTDHTELYVTDADAQRLVPTLPDIFDEPFADASGIPTFLLAKLTRAHVTVALTGDGGDESFGGYLRYRNHEGMVGCLYGMPRPLRASAAALLERVPAGAWEALVVPIPNRRRPRFIASKVAKVCRALRLDSAAERGKSYLSFWDPGEVVLGAYEDTDPFVSPACLAMEPSEAMQYWETRHYLPGDLLAKADRATMAASLEARCPLLDHRVVELAWRLPPTMKASRGASKRILRNLLFRYVPQNLVDLPKQGFSVPVGSWMHRGLRDWTEATLDYGRRHTADLLDWRVIDAAWQAHSTGRIGYSEKLWTVVMFAAWHGRWLSPGSESHGA
jgi:asparagine synthase (glutamine-hydrolysing)